MTTICQQNCLYLDPVLFNTNYIIIIKNVRLTSKLNYSIKIKDVVLVFTQIIIITTSSIIRVVPIVKDLLCLAPGGALCKISWDIYFLY